MEEAIVISYGGVTTSQVIPQDPDQILEFLQTAVGGWIEHVSFPVDGVDAYINEEGKIIGLQENALATAIMRNAGMLFTGDYIAGHMILTGTDDMGETVGLTEEQHEAIRNLI